MLCSIQRNQARYLTTLGSNARTHGAIMNRPLEHNRTETTDEFIDRAIQTRGKIEQTFWSQAGRLKRLFDSIHPKGILQQLHYECAKERCTKANNEYLDDDLEAAIKLQRKALQELEE